MHCGQFPTTRPATDASACRLTSAVAFPRDGGGRNGRGGRRQVAAAPRLESRILLAPKGLTSGMVRPLGNNDYDWKPEHSGSGPITIVMSGADRRCTFIGTAIPSAALPGVKWPRIARGIMCPRCSKAPTDRRSFAVAGPGRAKVDDRDEQWPQRSLPTSSRSTSASTRNLRQRSMTPSNPERLSSLPINRSCGAAERTTTVLEFQRVLLG